MRQGEDDFLKRAGLAPELTWTMDSSLPFFLFWMKKSMEGFIGMDYDPGLKHAEGSLGVG